MDDNANFFLEESKKASAILQRNRHRSMEPFEWFGPKEEPCAPGPDCPCWGCDARFRVPGRRRE